MTMKNRIIKNVSKSGLRKYYRINDFYEAFLHSCSSDQRVAELDALWKEFVDESLEPGDPRTGLTPAEAKKYLVETEKDLFADAVENFYDALFKDREK